MVIWGSYTQSHILAIYLRGIIGIEGYVGIGEENGHYQIGICLFGFMVFGFRVRAQWFSVVFRGSGF